KEESLALLDRAASLRPDLLRLLKESAERWAEWGDAARALERLDAYRKKARPEETRATDELRARLASRPASPPSILTTTSLPELSSPALDAYRLAQVLFRRGDAASLASARREAEEAERLDPSFAPALELLAAIQERQGDAAAAEAALRRALT